MTIQLIVDDRERAITPYLAGFSYLKIVRLANGDYNILVNKKLVMTIERKTLEDYASSRKDGRHANVINLLKLREKTNCQIMYIIEGDLSPNDDTEYAGIKYKHIKTSIIHLQTQFGIQIMRSKSKVETAKFLMDLCKSYLERSIMFDIESIKLISLDNVFKCNNNYYRLHQVENPVELYLDMPIKNIILYDNIVDSFNKLEIEKNNLELTNAIMDVNVKLDDKDEEQLLYIKEEKNILDLKIQMWMNVTGIGPQTAIALANYTVLNIFKLYNESKLSSIQMPNGSNITTKVITIINNIFDKDKYLSCQIELLCGIKGIGKSTAIQIINNNKNIYNILINFENQKNSKILKFFNI